MDNVLLNPGPTNTLECVKEAQTQNSDVCHRTDEFLNLLSETKTNLLHRFSKDALDSEWNVSIFGGSGTAAMEALISSLMTETNILIAGNYGRRALEMMSLHGVKTKKYYLETEKDLETIKHDNLFSNLYFVENETTTGEKFSLEKVVKYFSKDRLYIDATSAFGATNYTKYINNIDAISFCSNKCLQSTPGLGIVIWRKKLNALNRSYYLNLNKHTNSNLPFTLPVQSVAALNCALKKSYISEEQMNYRRDKLINDLAKINIKCINFHPSNSIIGFSHPNKNYNQLQQYLKNKNIIIYNGIENVENSFRIATMSVEFDKKYEYILRCFYNTVEEI